MTVMGSSIAIGRPEGDIWAGAGDSGLLRASGGSCPMRVGQLSESDAVDALRNPFYSFEASQSVASQGATNLI